MRITVHQGTHRPLVGVRPRLIDVGTSKCASVSRYTVQSPHSKEMLSQRIPDVKAVKVLKKKEDARNMQGTSVPRISSINPSDLQEARAFALGQPHEQCCALFKDRQAHH